MDFVEKKGELWGKSGLLVGKAEVGEVFPDKVHILHLPAAAVEMLQRPGVGGEAELQAVGVQGLAVAAVFPVLPLPAVLAVPQQGVARGGKLSPDLMGAPGDQVALHQGEPAVHRQGAVQRDGSFSTGDGTVVDRDLLFGLIL